MQKTVFITGATSGIGKACAEIFARNGFNIIANGRRAERLNDLKNELEKNFPVKVLTVEFDVQEKEQVFAAAERLPSDWQQIDVLINNAGLALGKASFEDADLGDWETMLHTNVEGLLFVSKAFLPFVKKSPAGHIINIGSIAGKEVYENGNVYCASKFAVDAITKAMRIELMPAGIKVTGIHPGAVETEFSLVRFNGNEDKARAAYKGLKPLSGADVANTIWFCANLPLHVCINELTITCLQQANVFYYDKKP